MEVEFFFIAELLAEEPTASFLLTYATLSSLLRVAPSRVESLCVRVCVCVCVCV